MTTATLPNRFVFIAGRPWLDFVNTTVIESGRRTDRLSHSSSLIDWLESSGLVDPNVAAKARRRWGMEARTLRLARSFRDHLRSLAESIIDRQRVPDEGIAVLNRLLARRAMRTSLRKTRSGFEHETTLVLEAPEDLLVPIANDLADFLCHEEWNRVGRCRSDACILVFWDTSRNHGRQWCSMQTCGNRAKVAAHYERRKRTERSGKGDRS